MTKKDFELLASNQRTSRRYVVDEAKWAIDFASENLARNLQELYPRFDLNRFLVACDYKREEREATIAKLHADLGVN